MDRYRVAAVLLLMAGAAKADVLGLVVGGESWRADTTQSLSAGSELRAENTSQQPGFYLRFEHPVPLLPNIGVRQQQLRYSASGTAITPLMLGQQSLATGTSVQLNSSGQLREVLAYYELLDNPLLDVDAGLAFRQLDLSLQARTSSGVVLDQPVQRWRPAVYANLALSVWGTEHQLFAQATYSDLRDDVMRDWRAGIAWRWLDITPIQSSLILGYRHSQLELHDVSNTSAVLRQQGPYLALEFDF